jgi:hypothetical protein
MTTFTLEFTMPQLLAAIKANPLQFLQMLLPFIQKLFQMMTGANDRYDRTDGNTQATKDYLKELDEQLKTLNAAAKAAGLPPLNLPENVDTVEEATWVKTEIQNWLKEHGTRLGDTTVQQMERTIQNLDKAIARLTKDGKLEDPNWDAPQRRMLAQQPGTVQLVGSGQPNNA